MFREFHLRAVAWKWHPTFLVSPAAKIARLDKDFDARITHWTQLVEDGVLLAEVCAIA
jgi:hypothetical protein